MSVATLFLLPVLLFLIVRVIRLRTFSSASDGVIAVLVLGDLGRSPRMQYHALSLAAHGERVHLIGYTGSPPLPAISTHPFITVHQLLPPFLQNVPRRLFVLNAPLKLSLQILQLFYCLMISMPWPKLIIVQNPPSIPTLLVAKIVCILRDATLIVDWHNFGFSLLAIKLGENHLFVKIATMYERICGGLGGGHLCVTRAMKEWLAAKWNIKASVLHDCPAPMFHPTLPDAAHELFSREVKSGPIGGWISQQKGFAGRLDSLFTASAKGKIEFREDRPALLVSPTSWTPDENMDLALDAVELYDNDRQQDKSLPPIVFVITGKGPDKERGEGRMREMNRKLHSCAVASAFLSPDDYPKLLGCCDLGISLHVSSSGLDLPMKVVDLFGCSVPVCAKNFQCIEELVRDGDNGLVFDTAKDLASHLKTLLRGFPNESQQLKKLKAGAAKSGSRRWSDEWNECAWPVLAKFAKRRERFIRSYLVISLLTLAVWKC